MDVSVIIPTYNRPKLLRETLESVVGQEVSPREIIVVDNGTNDETQAMIAANFGQIVYLRMPSEGMQAARNLGIERAQGEWIATLDDDDLWRPDFLSHAREPLADGRANLIYSDHRKFDCTDNGRIPFGRTNFESAPPGYWDGIPRPAKGEHWCFIGSFPIERLLRFNPFYPSTMIAKRSLVKKIGCFNPDVRRMKSEDIEFLSRALPAGQVAAIWRPLVDYRVHGGNSCGNDLTAQALGRWRIFEFVQSHGAYGNDRLRAALEKDLPGRRARAFDRAWRASKFEDMDEIRPLLRDSDWTLSRRLRQAIRLAPEPIRSSLMRVRGALPGRHETNTARSALSPEGVGTTNA